MYPDLKGKVAVVTGSSTGLGKAMAIRFLQEDMKVIVNYFQDEQHRLAEEMIQEFRAKGESNCAFAVQADIRTEKGHQTLYDAAIDHFGDLDLWVNNAGIENREETHKLSLEDWNDVIQTDLTGVFLGSKQALNHFLNKRKKGGIINMSSVHERIPWPTFAHYTAAKAGVMMFTKTIAMEYAKRKVRVNCIAPGAIETEINAEKFADPFQKKQTQDMIPMDKIGQAGQVADAAAWLASEQSSYVTGTSLFVDGGMSLYPSFEKGDG